VRVRLVTRLFVAPLALAAVLAHPSPSLALAEGPSCGEQLVKNEKGVQIKILFAKNGTVQRYLVLENAQNTEDANDLRLSLEQRYGQAGVDAPPMHIVSFKSGSGGMMVPDKAVDSCGRTLSFQ
jgi:hypothetical protein